MDATYRTATIETDSEAQAEIRRLSEYLDSKYKVAGFKIGWDGILGLIPGLGDLITNAFSFYIVYRASQLGCPPSVILRMGLNLIIDNFLDAIPIIGNLFDFMWKANTKNVKLMENYLANPRGTVRSSRAVVTFTLIFMAAVVIGCVVLTLALAVWLFDVAREAM